MVHVGDRLVTVDNQQRGDADAMRHALATRARIVLRFRQRRLGARRQAIPAGGGRRRIQGIGRGYRYSAFRNNPPPRERSTDGPDPPPPIRVASGAKFPPTPAGPPTGRIHPPGWPPRMAPPNVITYNAAISACGKSGHWDRALQLFDEMVSQGLAPNVISPLGRVSSTGPVNGLPDCGIPDGIFVVSSASWRQLV